MINQKRKQPSDKDCLKMLAALLAGIVLSIVVCYKISDIFFYIPKEPVTKYNMWDAQRTVEAYDFYSKFYPEELERRKEAMYQAKIDIEKSKH